MQYCGRSASAPLEQYFILVILISAICGFLRTVPYYLKVLPKISIATPSEILKVQPKFCSALKYLILRLRARTIEFFYKREHDEFV